MKIRDKILVYFSGSVIGLSAISLIIIYLLFYAYREEEFQQLQNEKIAYTIGLVSDFQKMSEELSLLLDAQDIHDFYDEKLLIFNSEKELIFSSIDNLTVDKTEEVLGRLSPDDPWIETKEGKYDLIGVYIENRGKGYYAISKAYDAFGYSKLYFLRNVLTVLFGIICLTVILLSVFLSTLISKPLTSLAEKLSVIDIKGGNLTEIEVQTSTYELQLLTRRFNEMLRRTNAAFSFQKHTIHHISHELKTPISILVSELEKVDSMDESGTIKSSIKNQISNAKALGNIINVLLEMAKLDSGQELKKESTRIDELLFDAIAELGIIHPDFSFDLNYLPEMMDESVLDLKVNRILMRQAFLNLLSNCISFSENRKGSIMLDGSTPDILSIRISNTGTILTGEEEKYLFNHFFRGENSRNKTGFGLGLVLTRRILELHEAEIRYSAPAANLNVFEIRMPLR